MLSTRPFLLCLLLLLPGSAWATTPIVQYPVQGKVPDSTLRSTTDLILGGVQLSKGRGGFEPGSPFLLPAACSPVTSVCLAALGQGQYVLYADAKAKEDGQVSVTVWLVSPAGERSRPVRFEFDPFLQNARAGYQAIALLEQQALIVGRSVETGVPPSPSPVRTPSQAGPFEAVSAASAPGASEQAAAASGPTTASLRSGSEQLSAASGTTAPSPQSGPEPAGPLSTSSSTAPAAAVSLSDPEPPHPSAWMSTAGNIGTYGGLGVLAGGAVFGLLSRNIHDDLSARYQAGELRASDAGKYQQVRTFNLLANSLMIGGAVASAVGLTFWALAPSASPAPGGGTFSVSGRF